MEQDRHWGARRVSVCGPMSAMLLNGHDRTEVFKSRGLQWSDTDFQRLRWGLKENRLWETTAVPAWGSCTPLLIISRPHLAGGSHRPTRTHLKSSSRLLLTIDMSLETRSIHYLLLHPTNDISEVRSLSISDAALGGKNGTIFSDLATLVKDDVHRRWKLEFDPEELIFYPVSNVVFYVRDLLIFGYIRLKG